MRSPGLGGSRAVHDAPCCPEAPTAGYGVVRGSEPEDAALLVGIDPLRDDPVVIGTEAGGLGFTEADPDVLRLEIGLQALGSHLASDATLLPTAERTLELGDVVDVDPDAAELELLR